MSFKERLANLFCVKSIVTIAMTAFLGGLLFGAVNPPSGITELYCTTYGAVITYFFTRKDSTRNNKEE